MRKLPTPAEDILWQILRNRQIDGYRFRRQHSIGLYIVDFYCDSESLAIEVDGSIHQNPKQMKKDGTRTKWIQSVGHRLIRFTNNEVINHTHETIEAIKKALHTSQNASLSLPPPGEGGGQGDDPSN